MKKMYKPLIETPDGGLVSVWAGGNHKSVGVRLSYKEGEITYNPERGAGIWVSDSLQEARSQGIGNKNREGIIVVHEVTPLGGSVASQTGLPLGSIFTSCIRYPAVLVGKRVYPEEEPKPEPKPEPIEEWEDITKECKFKLWGWVGFLVEVIHEGAPIFWIGLDGIVLSTQSLKGDASYGVAGGEETTSSEKVTMFRILKKVS